MIRLCLIFGYRLLLPETFDRVPGLLGREFKVMAEFVTFDHGDEREE